MRYRSESLVMAVLLLVTAFSLPVAAVSVQVSTGADQSLSVSGQVTGNMTSEVALWIFGPGYSGVTIIPVRADGRFVANPAPEGVSALAPGTYAVYVQDPGADRTYDVSYDPVSRSVIKTRTGEQLFPLGGSSGLAGTSAAEAISRAFQAQVVDDHIASAQAQIGIVGTVTGAGERQGDLPSITAKISSRIVAPGEEVTVSGTASGSSRSVALWIIGPDSFEVSMTPAGQGGSFSLAIPSSKTGHMTPGQYMVVVEDPAINNRLDILYDPNSGAVSRSGTNKVLFTTKGPGALKGKNAADTLVDAFKDPSVDDRIAQVMFEIAPGQGKDPAAGLNPASTPGSGQKAMQTPAEQPTTLPAGLPFPAILLSLAIPGAIVMYRQK